MADEPMTALEKMQLQTEAKNDSAFHWEDRDFRNSCPQLFEILAVRQTVVGPREPGRMTIFVDEGNLKVGIFCPTEARMAFVTLDRLNDVFRHVEELIVAGKVDWRKMKPNGNGSRSRF